MRISKNIRYYNFGYIPAKNWKSDLFGRLFGYPNLLKRLQARPVIELLDLKPNEVVLDFGCGAGFFTIEIAKIVNKAIGADINSYVNTIIVPNELEERLRYIVLPKESNDSDYVLPFESESIDKILISDVYVTLTDPLSVSKEFYRILKKRGKLVVVNTLGRCQIKKAYDTQPLWFKVFSKLVSNRPDTYDDYVAIFFQLDNLRRKRWDTLSELTSFIEEAQFTGIKTYYPFKSVTMGLCFWWQYFNICRGKGMVLNFRIVTYYLMIMLALLCQEQDPSNVVMIANKE
jgi:ubiquinone/menaquinone biosynthesis C-methylase UbiE